VSRRVEFQQHLTRREPEVDSEEGEYMNDDYLFPSQQAEEEYQQMDSLDS
jgi:hypothetical protein